MDHKKSPNRRTKRKVEDNYWDCSVCTYRNNAEAFKCLMCDIRKGTSTRKPRFNPQLVAQQVAQQFTPAAPKIKKEGGSKSDKKSSDRYSKKGKLSRLKNVDRSTAQHREVTVNNVTVIITEYKAKLVHSDHSGQSSSSRDSEMSHSESSTDARTNDLNTDSRSS